MILTQLFWELWLIWLRIWDGVIVVIASAVVTSLVVLMIEACVEWLSILPLFVMITLCIRVVGWFPIFSYMDVAGAVENLFQIDWMKIPSSAAALFVTSIRIRD